MADLTITKPNDELWDGVNSVRRWANRWMSCESQDRTLILEAITDGLASVLEGQPFDVAHANRFYLNCLPGQCDCDACMDYRADSEPDSYAPNLPA